MSDIFVKQLNAQELGFRRGVSHSAGGYFLIPKKCTPFFPPLSILVRNDNTSFSVNGVDVDYIYYNSKHTSKNPRETRDEFRFYVKPLIAARYHFLPKDIIVLEENQSGGYNLYQYPPTHLKYPLFQVLIGRYRKSRASSALVPSHLVTLP